MQTTKMHFRQEFKITSRKKEFFKLFITPKEPKKTVKLSTREMSPYFLVIEFRVPILSTFRHLFSKVRENPWQWTFVVANKIVPITENTTRTRIFPPSAAF